MFLISSGVLEFSYDKDFCNVGVCIPIIAFDGVLSKSLESSSKGSKISLLEILGWVSDIFIEGLAIVKATSFSFYKTNQNVEQLFLLNITFWVISCSITSSIRSLCILCTGARFKILYRVSIRTLHFWWIWSLAFKIFLQKKWSRWKWYRGVKEPTSSAPLWFVNVRERKPRERKKMKLSAKIVNDFRLFSLKSRLKYFTGF